MNLIGSTAIDENVASVMLKNLIASKSIFYWLILLILIVKNCSINESSVYADIWLPIHRHVLCGILNVKFLLSYAVAIAHTCIYIYIYIASRTVFHDAVIFWTLLKHFLARIAILTSRFCYLVVVYSSLWSVSQLS